MTLIVTFVLAFLICPWLANLIISQTEVNQATQVILIYGLLPVGLTIVLLVGAGYFFFLIDEREKGVVSAQCGLSENSLRILRRTFGEVKIQ